MPLRPSSSGTSHHRSSPCWTFARLSSRKDRHVCVLNSSLLVVVVTQHSSQLAREHEGLTSEVQSSPVHSSTSNPHFNASMIARTFLNGSKSAQNQLSRAVGSIGSGSAIQETPLVVPSGSSRRLSTASSDNDRLLVVGSGVAGSAAALIAAETYKIPVTLLFAGTVPHDCNSNWAQGGIIYRNYDPASGDSADLLSQDIHRAGAGLCVDEAVRKVSEEGPERVRQLLLAGAPFADVPFDKKPDGELSLCLGKSIHVDKRPFVLAVSNLFLAYRGLPCGAKNPTLCGPHWYDYYQAHHTSGGASPADHIATPDFGDRYCRT